MPSAADFLLTLPRFTEVGAAAYRPGLERMEALLAAMERPHTAFESVHVAGTNGKGSTSSMLAAIVTATGRRVGLHTSPHLVSVTERMRVNGAPVPERWLDGAVARYRPLFDEVGPSFFEATVALSFLYFAEQAVDLAVVEVGLGGRLDATNILLPRLSLITNIGLDHTELLGGTREEIAREKAGIIKEGVPILTTTEHVGALAAIRGVAAERHAPFHDVREEVRIGDSGVVPHGLVLELETPLRRYPSLQVGLAGSHQRWNAALAVRGAELLFGESANAVPGIYTGLREAPRLSGLRGRFEVLREAPTVIADVGHNAEGIAATLQAVRARLREGRLCVAVGAMRDKDVACVARLLDDAAAEVFACHIASERAYTATGLAALLEGEGVRVAGSGSLSEALAWFERTAAPPDLLLVTGSHQLVAQLPEMQGAAISPW